LNSDTASEYLGLCQKAARIAANGKKIDYEEVSQELMIWILTTKAINSPSYKGLQGLLVKQARQLLWNETHHFQPSGWSGCPWAIEDIRRCLLNDYNNLPSQIAEGLESDRLPESYRSAVVSRYGDGVKPKRNSAGERTLSRGVQRLQEVVNFPLDTVTKPPRIAIEDLTEEDEGVYSIAVATEQELRRRENEEAGRKEDRKNRIMADIAAAKRR
jgi:hypothetical protein